ncbi:helix-turn-helix transcriptional regulator [Amycolatopsis tucumanensis]|uniref:helix-turn-helix domain-containing protein n=1 Tax=Amycolatopsis TaxID=1813 RepID=UPI0031EF3FAE
MIRELRKERGWNQTQLGAAVGVDQSTVSEWERGAAVPRELRAIADALGVPFDRFRQVIEAAAAAADAVEEAIRSQSLLSKESMEALVVMYRKVLAADTADLGRN